MRTGWPAYIAFREGLSPVMPNTFRLFDQLVRAVAMAFLNDGESSTTTPIEIPDMNRPGVLQAPVAAPDAVGRPSRWAGRGRGGGAAHHEPGRHHDLARRDRASYGYDVRGEVLGSGGMVTAGDGARTTATFAGASGRVVETVRSDQELFADAYVAELAAFTGAVRDGTEPAVTGEDARAALEIALRRPRAARERFRSAATG